MKPRRPPEVCPVCDADVPSTAKACPECGACYESGWGEDDGEDEEVDYSTLDLPDSAWDGDDERRPAPKPKFNPMWRWVALVVLIAFFLGFWVWLGQQFSLWGGSFGK